MALLRWSIAGAGRLIQVTSSATSSGFAGFRFPREVISLAVRWHLRSGLSYRDVEELLAERGSTVDHVTIDRWVQRSADSRAKPESGPGRQYSFTDRKVADCHRSPSLRHSRRGGAGRPIHILPAEYLRLSAGGRHRRMEYRLASHGGCRSQ
jgi:IS6 family transposase